MFQNIPIQLIVILIFLGISAVSWTLKKLGEQRAIREAQARAARERDELLRTGRPPESAAPERPPLVAQDDATARLKELAAKRQAQLNELRRQAQAKARAQGTPAPTPQAAPTSAPRPGQTRELWPGGPVVVVAPAPPGGAPAPVAPTLAPVPQRRAATAGAPSTDPRQLDAARKRAERARAEVSKRVQMAEDAADARRAAELREKRRRAENAADSVTRAAERVDGGTSRRNQPRPATQGPSAAHSARAMLDRLSTPEAWRQAIVVSEVLGQPVSVRDRHGAVGLS